MVDTRSPVQRRRIMQSVKTANTGPEMTVRRLLHGMGYRYRLHAKELPGKPDIVLRPRRKAIFVHGCFWHGHGCKTGQAPKSRQEYWLPKIEGNKERDRRSAQILRDSGWDVLIVWQCDLTDVAELREMLRSFVEASKNTIDNPSGIV